MPRSRLFALVFLHAFLLCPSLAHAQGKDQFVQALVDFITAAEGTKGDEGPSLLAAIDKMAEGLTQWDVFLSRVEAGLASEIGAAPPATAARMRTALGTAYLDRGRVDAALAQFEMAVALDPAYADVHAFRGLAFESTNRSREAADAYREAWRRDQQNPAHAYRFLRTRDDHGDVAERTAAMKVLLAAVSDAPSGAAPPSFATLALLDDASVPAPEFSLARYADAFALLRQGKYDQAVNGLRTAAASDSLLSNSAATSKDSAEAHRILGVSYATSSQHDKSVEELRAAIRLDPANERARLALADVLVAGNDAAAARIVLAETVQTIPASGQALWKLGTIHQSFGDDANAVRSFEAAARLSPFAGAGLLQGAIGRLYHNQLDLDAAIPAYTRQIVLTPNAAAPHLDLAEVYRAQDRLDAALAESLVAALLEPTSARSFATIGQIHAAAGRDTDAVTALRKAVALDPAHLEAHYALSRALSRLNRADEAREELQIFERLQAKAMAEQRQRFQDNQQHIEETLKTAEPKDRQR